jgi:hypothetical protein
MFKSLKSSKKLNQRGDIVIGAIIVLIVLSVGGLLVYKYYYPAQPKACSLEAKVCSDGSYVSRTGPNCNFARCPNEPSTTGSASKTHPDGTGGIQLEEYPDLPLPDSIPTPVSVKFLVEHRSALNGKTVELTGVVTATILGESACPNNGTTEYCAQPSIYVAESNETNRDQNYDIRIIMAESTRKDKYAVGQNIQITVLVDSTNAGIVLVAAE